MTSKSRSPQSVYPRPGAVGGRLMRRVVAFLRAQGVELPIATPLVIAVSGGSDSLALALLLARYGRRVGSGPLYWVHFEHGWSSSSAAQMVVSLGRSLGVSVVTQKLPGPETYPQGASWEEHARTLRYARLEWLRSRVGAQWVMTAHQQEDLAESVLWALCSGNAAVRGGGILARTESLLRPFLGIQKKELQAFLREEGQEWFEDHTNADSRFLRAQLREQVFPALLTAFPRAVEHLASLGMQAQRGSPDAGASDLPGKWLLELSQEMGVRVRSSHFKEIRRTGSVVHLPQGWKLQRKGACQNSGKHPIESEERWILEKGPGKECLTPRS